MKKIETFFSLKGYVLLAILLLVTVTLFADVKETNAGIEFSYDAANAQSVFLVGSMNGWNTSATPMQKGADGTWRITVPLSAGSHQYKFMVDGVWNFDQNNSDTADDGYGGFNSVVKVGENGKVALKKADSLSGIKTSLNPKMLLNGRYYTVNHFRKNGNSRYMLDKPSHQLNLAPKIKFSDDFSVVTVLNANNDEEGTDIWKTHLRYKKVEMNLHTDVVDFYAFDNAGQIVYDDPLRFLGNEGKYHFGFGYEHRGVEISSQGRQFGLIAPSARALFAERSGNSSNIDNLDIISARVGFTPASITSNPLVWKDGNWKLNGSLMSVRIPLSNNKDYQEHMSYAIDTKLTHNLANYVAGPLQLRVLGEFYQFTNKDHNSNSAGDKTVDKWMDGYAYYAGTELQFPLALQLGAAFQHNQFDGNALYKRDKVLLNAKFDVPAYYLSANMQWWKNSIPTSDSLMSWGEYYQYMEKYDGKGRWFQQFNEIPFSHYPILGYDNGVVWDLQAGYRFQLYKWSYLMEVMSQISATDLMDAPRLYDNQAALTWNLTNKWQVYTNWRLPVYRDDFWGFHTNIMDHKNVFVSNYSSLAYIVNPNVKVAVSWGVNPTALNNTTDEFYNGGREDFLEAASDYLSSLESGYPSAGQKIKEAEKALSKEKRISVEAVLSF